jgi:hypothetical protein
MKTAIAKDTDLGMHLSDLKAFLTHFDSVVSEQMEKTRNDGVIASHELNLKLQGVLRKHLGRLEVVCDAYAGDFQTASKELLTSFLGAAAGLYNKYRDYPHTKALRDNYTALSLLAASYTTLKAYGLMIGREDVSLLAYEGLEDICPLIIDFSQRMPEVVVRETAVIENMDYDQAVADRVTNAVKRCWKN